MSQDPSNASVPPEQPGGPEQPQQAPPAKPAHPPKRRRRRRWPWVIVALLLLIVVIVALAPTIASTAVVRSFVVGKINNNLNGHAEIADWSFSWSGPQTINGVKVYDDQNRLLLEAKARLGISLINAARQNFALGDNNQIDVGLNINVDKNGHTNLEQLLKQRPGATSQPATGGPLKVPNISGKFVVNFQGTIAGEGVPKPINIDPSQATVVITDINKPIDDSLKLAYRIASSARESSRIEASGSFDAFENNQLVDLNKQLVAKQKLDLTNVELTAAEPFLKSMGPDTKLGGVATGSLDANVQGLTGISANGQIDVANLLFAGGPLKPGDQFASDKVTIPVNITRTVVDPNTTRIKIEQLAVQMPKASIAVTGEVTQESLLNLKAGKPPGATGNLSVKADLDPTLANQLRNTLQLEKNVEIKGGSIHEDLKIAIAPDRVTINQQLNASASGTRNQQPVQIQPITVSADATAIPTGKPIPELRDIKLAVDSAFAKVQGSGTSLAQLDINGNFDLAKLRDEAAQFADLSKVQLQGSGDFKIGTNGDLSSENAPVVVTANANLNKVKVTGLANRPIDQDRLAVVASGNILRQNNSPVGVEKGYLAAIGGDPNAPLIDIAANANLDLHDMSKPKASWFQLAKCTISSLPMLQDQYGGFIPVLAEQKLKIESGSLYAQAEGSYDGTTLTFSKPAGISLPTLTITKDGRPLLSRETLRASVNGNVSKPPEGLSAQLSELSVTTESKLFDLSKSGNGPLVVSMKGNAIQGNGQMAMNADLKRLMDLAQAFGGQVIVQPNQPQLQSGQFSGTIALVKADKPQTNLDFNGQISGLTISSQGRNALDNEQVTIELHAIAPDDLNGTAPVTANGKIGSSFANTTLSDVKIAPSAGLWDKLQSATLQIQAPDLPKLDALWQALFPPAPAQAAVRQTPADDVRHVILAMAQQSDAPPVRGNERISSRRPVQQTEPQPVAAPQPNAPLEITSGGAMIKVVVNRDLASKTTTLDVPDLRISKLALKRGDRQYRFDRDNPISLKLAAAVQAASDPTGNTSILDQIESVKVSDLSGDLRVAKLSMPTPIVARNLAQTPDVQGGIRIEGSLGGDGGLAPLLAVVNGSNLPYNGDYVVTQNVKTTGNNNVSLDGKITATKFQAMQDGTVAFSEDRIDIDNKLDLDLNNKSANIQAITLTMPSSQALGINLTGSVRDWAIQRQLRNIKLDLSYDLEKLFPIIHPLLITPGQEDQFKDAKMAGKYTKTFLISGSYPATDASGKPLSWNQSIKTVSASGDLSIDLLDAMGLNVQNWNIPIDLSKGHAAIVYAGKPKDQRLPKPAQCNGGTLDIGGIDVDLTQPVARVSIGRNQRLLRNATINPLLGDTLGKYVNPVFANSQRAKGLLDLTVSYCNNVAMDPQAIKSENSGTARIVFSITDMDIANPIGSLMLGPVFSALQVGNIDKTQADTFQGQIKDAVVSLDHGVANTDITMQLIDTGRPSNVVGSQQPAGKPVVMPLSFKGDIRLSDLQQNLTVTLPPRLIAKFVPTDNSLGNNLAKIFPEGIPIALRGTTTKPQPDVGDIGRAFLEGQLKTGAGGLLEGVLGGKKNDNKNSKGSGRSR